MKQSFFIIFLGYVGLVFSSIDFTMADNVARAQACATLYIGASILLVGGQFLKVYEEKHSKN